MTKTGSHDLYLSCADISGTGVIDVQSGTMTICNNRVGDVNPRFPNGTLRIANGATFNLAEYNGKYPVFTVKNLDLNGSVHRNNSGITLTVTGYVSGYGTTPMLTLAEGAVLKPTGTGYLKITESLVSANEVITIDISGVDFDSRTSLPLFKVGKASMLPDASSLNFIGTIPEGWALVLSSDKLGYRLRKNNGFAIRML